MALTNNIKVFSSNESIDNEFLIDGSQFTSGTLIKSNQMNTAIRNNSIAIKALMDIFSSTPLTKTDFIDNIVDVSVGASTEYSSTWLTGFHKNIDSYLYNARTKNADMSDTVAIATSSNVGGIISSTTGTTPNMDYMVEVNSSTGTAKVNVPWVNTTYKNGTNITVESGTGSSQNAVNLNANLTGLESIICTTGEGSINAITITTQDSASTSDRRAKKDIRDTSINGLDIINDINVKEFKYLNKDNDYVGCIAQELIEVLPDNLKDSIVMLNNQTNLYGINDSRLIYILIKAVQELSAEIKELKK